jgi:hypothetical protein
MFINKNTAPTYYYTLFLNNSASLKGNDVFHVNSTLIGSYSLQTIINSCSTSKSEKFYFSDESNVDNLFSVWK